MANAFYAKGAERVWRGTINWETANIKVALMRDTYIQDLAAHEFWADISSHEMSNAPVALTGKVVSGLTFDADDVTFPSVEAGLVCEACVFFLDTGDDATSPVLLYVDDPAGFPFTGTGGDQLIQWSNGAYKIVSL